MSCGCLSSSSSSSLLSLTPTHSTSSVTRNRWTVIVVKFVWVWVWAVLVLVVSEGCLPCESFVTTTSTSTSTSTSTRTSTSTTRASIRRPRGFVSSPPSITALRSNSSRGPSNPFVSVLSDLWSSMANNNGGDLVVPSMISDTDTTVWSWPKIREELESMQTPEEAAFRRNLEFGYGAASPLHKVRLYDNNENRNNNNNNNKNNVRVVFYRDSASWCPYCQKVWMSLEEKRIPYRVEKINMSCYGSKPRSFLQLQPSGAIPVAEIDGVVYNQSNDIMAALEQLFPNHKPLLPSSSSSSQRARELLSLERQFFSAWLRWLTGPPRGRTEFVRVLQRVETALKEGGGPFFLGSDVSTVDFMYAPFLERMAASLVYFKGFVLRSPSSSESSSESEYPHVNAWFDAMETLDSYRVTKSDYYTHCWDLPPQLGGCTYEDAGDVYRQVINGERRELPNGKDNDNDNDQGGWELPLGPNGVEPDWSWCQADGIAQREAVERLSANAAAVVSFASRGASAKGMLLVMASLSDPNAVPNEPVQPAVDAVLRAVCMELLSGTTTTSSTSTSTSTTQEFLHRLKDGADQRYIDATVQSLAYLRDRIGVPRDMRLPAARYLRAHLNRAIAILIG